jgi:hypothetical protein
MYNLGVMFLQGQGTVKNEVEGFKWIRQAAEGGDPRASYVYGVLLCEGKGVVKNAREGHSWLTKASEMGSVNAEARIGKDYLYGGDGFTAEPTKALPLIEKASESGNPWACGRLGEILEKGKLLPKDLEKSRSLFQKGAELGDPASQFEYARLLMMSDPVKAYPWIKLAEEGHDTRAIGLMTECRPGLTPDQVASGDAVAEKIRKNYQQFPSPGK